MKTLFTLAATVIGALSFLPYVKDIFSLKTKPHAYTWLIWAITQGTGVFGICYGGGGWGGLNLMVGFLFVVATFFLSLRYGSRNIKRSDTIVLVAAIVVILASWRIHNPLVAVIMASAVDFLGYVPSFRKSYEEPWSETLSTWIGFTLSNALALLALREYNLLTTVYLTTLVVANAILFLICIARRSFVARITLPGADAPRVE